MHRAFFLKKPDLHSFECSSFSVFVNLFTLTLLYSILKQQLELKVPGGGKENRTPDPLLARQVLSQLSYTPTYSEIPKAF